MRQPEARDLRSFLAEPVEEFVVEADAANRDKGKAQNTDTQLQEVGVQFITPWQGTEEELPGTGVQFTIPWEGTGGQLHEVRTRFTSPLTQDDAEARLATVRAQFTGVGAQFTSPWGNNTPWQGNNTSWESNTKTSPWDDTTDDQDDLALQQTMPIPRIAEQSVMQNGLSSLRPYRLQRYQSRGIPVSLSRSTSGTLRLRPADERRATADLAPAPQKIVPGEPSPALQSWERKRRTIYTWLILLTLFLLVILGGIGLDSLIASYR